MCVTRASPMQGWKYGKIYKLLLAIVQIQLYCDFLSFDQELLFRSVNGTYRGGLFALGDIASGAEITIDMNGLLPATRSCHCGASDCRKRVIMARNAVCC